MAREVDILGFLSARRVHDTEALRLQLRVNDAVTDEEKSALRVRLEDHLLAPPDPGEFAKAEAPVDQRA